MAGLEVVVRPVIFPDIRPRAKQSLPPQDDPTKGFAKIDGQPAQQVTMTFSQSISSSHNRPVETERRVDEVTVYQQQDDGTVNKKNFVKLKVANKITMRQEGYRVRPPADPLPPLLPGTPGPRPTTPDLIPNYYARVKPAPNIEITRKDVIEKNPDAPP